MSPAEQAFENLLRTCGMAADLGAFRLAVTLAPVRPAMCETVLKTLCGRIVEQMAREARHRS